MCVMYFCQTEIHSPDGYQLIIVSNRDESWTRPTQHAEFWGPRLDCISSLDKNPGNEGGTWLGMNKDGKIGALLNILGPVDLSKKGRGYLVSNYLSENCDMDDYAARIIKNKDKYKGFNLVLFDLGKQEDCLTAKPIYVTNAEGYHSCVTTRTLPSNTFFGISNSPLEYPMQKVVEGKHRFGYIVSQYPQTSMKEHLVEKLMGFMADTTPLMPDPVLERAGSVKGLTPDFVTSISAINIYSPNTKTGSRTTTVILVDGQGKVDYIEKNWDCLKPEPNQMIVHKKFNLNISKQEGACF